MRKMTLEDKKDTLKALDLLSEIGPTLNPKSYANGILMETALVLLVKYINETPEIPTLSLLTYLKMASTLVLLREYLGVPHREPITKVWFERN